MSNATTPVSSRLRDPLLTRSVKKLQSPVAVSYTHLTLPTIYSV